MLTTVKRAKKLLGIPEEDVSQDFSLEMALEAASAAIERECNREFGQKSHSQRINGSGTKFLRLRNFPIISVADVKICGDDISPDGFVIESDNGMLFKETIWPIGTRNIEVEYLAGYILPSDTEGAPAPTLPRNYEMACVLYAQTLLQTPGVTSERVGDISVAYAAASAGELPPVVAALIRL
ncbi:hypothetical protein EH198_09180 [Paenibacillus rhizophilus]|uniref:Phage gp6-like head-tail connector protein n=1 Tax=Paenibacillus rhizophilus TaxID=1850366 RepID=A0A3N9P9Z0_9BACL|nr:hypothetical protein EH198_09180 [Paenibacillus rhizophilus]